MTEELEKSSRKSTHDDGLNLEDFSYELPAELIAQSPAEKRDESRLFYYNRQEKNIRHLKFGDLNSILRRGDILVVNNTRVIPAKLTAKRASGGIVELLLIKKEPRQIGLWQAMATPIKKLQPGEILTICGKENEYRILVRDIVVAADGQKRLLVDLSRQNIHENAEDQTFTILQNAGTAPLPPYIVHARAADAGQNKGTEEQYEQKNKDLERYQTIFAREPGAVAAPTAGLHFSSDLMTALKTKGVTICEITLHVGPGTFKPITTSIAEHTVEAEWFSISSQVCDEIMQGKKNGQRIIAVGTTACRALESAYTNGQLLPQEAYTSLYIKPGYQFKLIDGLITNFHLSKSSLLLLVAAFVGTDQLMSMYQEAIEQRYRFYSYGDAMLIL